MASEVTLLLQEISDGADEQSTLDRLLPLVYDELRRLAGSFLNREHAVSLQTTELVHEAYFKLTEQRRVDWENRGQFFAVAAQAMRRILIDAARRRKSQKHGAVKIPIEDASAIATQPDLDLLVLNDALSELEKIDPDQCRIIELRYFAGLTIEETSSVLKISPATVKREWAIGRAWLFARINGR